MAGNHDHYCYPELGNWDNEITVTLTDKELKELIALQTGTGDSDWERSHDALIDYDELRRKYQEALENDDSKAKTEVNRQLFYADSYLEHLAENDLWITVK